MRNLRRIFDGSIFYICKPTPEKYSRGQQLPAQLFGSRKITPVEAFENKRKNIEEALDKINNLEIAPGEIFSFWAIVGNANQRTKGGASRIYGGGLDELAGLMYYVLLRAGFEFRERHAHRLINHMRDSSPVPGGFDAWVVYGYKDLAFRNNRHQHMAIRYHWEEHNLCLEICAAEPLQVWELHSEHDQYEEKIRIRTFRTNREGFKQRIATDLYRSMSVFRRITRQRTGLDV